jgi:hypothetical protein
MNKIKVITYKHSVNGKNALQVRPLPSMLAHPDVGDIRQPKEPREDHKVKTVRQIDPVITLREQSKTQSE